MNKNFQPSIRRNIRKSFGVPGTIKFVDEMYNNLVQQAVANLRNLVLPCATTCMDHFYRDSAR